MKKLIILLVVAVSAGADIQIWNSSSGAVQVYEDVVPAGHVVNLVYDESTVIVTTANRTQVFEVLDGTRLVVDDVGVTKATPLRSYLEVILRGFFFGLSVELFGWLVRVLRASRSRIGEPT